LEILFYFTHGRKPKAGSEKSKANLVKAWKDTKNTTFVPEWTDSDIQELEELKKDEIKAENTELKRQAEKMLQIKTLLAPFHNYPKRMWMKCFQKRQKI